jgi:hypothetical protein
MALFDANLIITAMSDAVGLFGNARALDLVNKS